MENEPDHSPGARSHDRGQVMSDEQSAPTGPLYAKRPGFEEWKAQVDLIAESEDLTPKQNPLPGELDVWIKHFNNGKTPAEAWRAVPYKRKW